MKQRRELAPVIAAAICISASMAVLATGSGGGVAHSFGTNSWISSSHGRSNRGCFYNGEWTTDGAWYFGGGKECFCSGGRWSECRRPPSHQPRPPPDALPVETCENGFLYDDKKHLCIKKVEESPVYVCEGKGCQTVMDGSYVDFCSSRLCVCKEEEAPRFTCPNGFKMANKKCERKVRSKVA